MDNKDLVKQYIDTGLQLPEYQLDFLSDNDKKSYIRKRLIAIANNNFSLNGYEFQYVTDINQLIGELKKMLDLHHSWVSPKTYIEDLNNNRYLKPIVTRMHQLYGEETNTIILKLLVKLWALRGANILHEMIQYMEPELLKKYCNAQLSNIFANGRDLTYDTYLLKHADVVVPEYLRYFKDYDKSNEIISRWSKPSQRTYLSLIEPFLKMPEFNKELSSIILFIILLRAEDIYKPQIFRLFLKNGGSMDKIQFIESDPSVDSISRRSLTKWYEEFKEKI